MRTVDESARRLLGRPTGNGSGRDAGHLGSFFHGHADILDAGGNDGDTHLVRAIHVEDRTKVNLGVLVRGVVHDGGRLADFLDGQIRSAGDVHEHAARAVDGHILQQGAGDGLHGGFAGAAVAGSDAGAHHGQTHLLHHGLHVGEIQIDQTGHDDQIGDALHGVEQDFVGLGQHVHERRLLGGQGQQAVIGDGDDAVDDLAQLLDAALGLLLTAFALEKEGLGDHGHGQGTQVLGHLGDDRRRAGARSATHAGGDKNHVAITENVANLGLAFQGRVTADIRIGPGTQALGQLVAELNLEFGLGMLQGLHVRVGGDEGHALHSGLDHVVHRVAAPTATPDHLDQSVVFSFDFQEIHASPFHLNVGPRLRSRPRRVFPRHLRIN